MSEITWNQMANPDFSSANALLVKGQDQFNNAVTQIGKGVTDYQKSITAKNTQDLLNTLYSAKTPEEFSAAAQQVQLATKALNGDYDQAQVQQLQDTRPGVLDTQQQAEFGRQDQQYLPQLLVDASTGNLQGISTTAGKLQSKDARAQAAQAIINANQVIQGNNATRKNDIEENYKTGQLAQAMQNAADANRNTQYSNETERKKLDPKSGFSVDPSGTTTNYQSPAGTRVTVDFTKGVAPADVGSLIDSQIGRTKKAEAKPGDSNFKNPNSTATGDYQIIGSTFVDQVRRNFPQIAAGKSDAQIKAMRGDTNLSAEVAKSYHTENANALTGAKVPVNQMTLDGAYFWGAGGATAAYKALQSDPNTPLSSVIGAKAVSANAAAWKNGGAKDPSNPTVADGWNAVAKRQGLLASDSKPSNTNYTFSSEFEQPRANAKNALDALNTHALTGNKITEAADTPTMQGQLSSYIKENQNGVMGKLFGINSGAEEQMKILNNVPGFKDLNSKGKLGVLKTLGGYNDTDGIFSKYTNKGNVELTAKGASLVQQALQESTSDAAPQRQHLYTSTINDWRAQLAKESANTQGLTNQMILDAAFGKGKTKDYVDPDAQSASANIVAATKTPASGVKPVTAADAPPVTSTQTNANTALGIRALKGLGNLRDKVSPINLVGSLFTGGSNATKEAANKLKYGSMYPIMVARNDPRLRN